MATRKFKIERKYQGRTVKVTDGERLAAMAALARATEAVAQPANVATSPMEIVDVGAVLDEIAQGLMHLGLNVDANTGGFGKHSVLSATTEEPEDDQP